MLSILNIYNTRREINEQAVVLNAENKFKTSIAVYDESDALRSLTECFKMPLATK